MNHYVALLRGINVGGNAKIDMKTLKETVESGPFHQVRTYINSGNVLFDSNQDPKTVKNNLEALILERFSVKVTVIIRDRDNLALLCESFPKSWINDDTQKTDILFLSDDYDSAETVNLIKHDPTIDTLIYVSGAIGWNVSRLNYPKSGMNRFIGTTVYKNMTA